MFFKWPIADKSTESVKWSTILVIKRSSISEFKHSSRITSCIASTSGQAVVNDIPPQYKHSSLYAAAQVLKDNPEGTTLRELALRVCSLV